MNQSISECKIYKNIESLKGNNLLIEHGGKRINKVEKNYEKINPLFTIITVVKNGQRDIEKTINSVFDQDYKNLEYIVIEGNSADNSLDIIKKFNNKINYWCSINDKGIYDAMNYGLKLAKGQIIGIINAGDIYKPDALSTVSKYFKKKDNLSFLFGTVERHYLGNNVILKSGFDRKRIKYNFDSVTCHSSGFFIKNRAQKELGLYDLKFVCSSDYDLFYRLITNDKYEGLSTSKNEIVGIVASGGFSSKYGHINKLLEEMSIRFKNNQNFFLIIIIFINSIIKLFLKKLKL